MKKYIILNDLVERSLHCIIDLALKNGGIIAHPHVNVILNSISQELGKFEKESIPKEEQK